MMNLLGLMTINHCNSGYGRVSSTTPIAKGGEDKPHMPSTKAIAGLRFVMEEAQKHLDTISKLGVEAHAASGDGDEVTRPQVQHRQGKTNSKPS
jgi:hypothetical protein